MAGKTVTVTERTNGIMDIFYGDKNLKFRQIDILLKFTEAEVEDKDEEDSLCSVGGALVEEVQDRRECLHLCRERALKIAQIRL